MKRVALIALELAPQNELSRLAGFYASKALIGPLAEPAIRFFAKNFNIDLDEVEKPISEYRSLAEFFARRLRPNARPIDARSEFLVSPVDGTVTEFGKIEETTLLQAKGKTYQLQHLLADFDNSKRFQNGSYITLYLSPRDYHRMHTPCDCTLSAMRYVPGRLFSVNAFGIENISSLYTINERLISYLETDCGQIAFVKIGALNVGRISVVYTDFHTNRRNATPVYYTPPSLISLKKGDEMAKFELGSTVILLFEPNSVEFLPEVLPYRHFKVGEAFARVLKKEK